jgi:hypothetical protein
MKKKLRKQLKGCQLKLKHRETTFEGSTTVTTVLHNIETQSKVTNEPTSSNKSKNIQNSQYAQLIKSGDHKKQCGLVVQLNCMNSNENGV